ncbi:hypothetical protein [Synechococcus elongatus]|uniref:hypothetical protein n=1 Tax=Synechococcus elongatus TaxID=32046 RepID=UPI000039FFF8|nr:hypothetical protein [Synechococcus elongatus]AJD58909.1 hypothetical protein M744_11815 [Synechococcus elongatus UTEX 2973]MBD2587410.1 hypothetical protein [Synechococcus elongatus FACHB-242]MBD2688811.1 hypothetical protein [Synechococcus elongatus FACHB-1061]MBD2707882.1 hypothetical protein [Synechococcus elongatus PCC 7942 = FACHB-805]WKW06559.1 hypothetical protein QY054_05115 [Synechococcus elongatus PCC 7942 = FACHB-805]
MMPSDLFLRAVQTAEIELLGETLSVMALDFHLAHCFWQRRQQLCASFGCELIEIYVGDRLVACDRYQASVDL